MRVSAIGKTRTTLSAGDLSPILALQYDEGTKARLIFTAALYFPRISIDFPGRACPWECCLVVSLGCYSPASALGAEVTDGQTDRSRDSHCLP